MMSRRLVTLAVHSLVLLLFQAGCGSDQPSPAQQFVRDQEGIVTPHGRIDASSVRELEGKLQYKTSDGRTWSASWTVSPDGSRDYGVPDEVKPTKESGIATADSAGD
jgi:hypothetical protein